MNRDSGTASANGGWLRRLVRPHGHFVSKGVNDARPTASETPASSFATPLWRAGRRLPAAAEALATVSPILRWKLPNCELAVPKHWFDAPTGLTALN